MTTLALLLALCPAEPPAWLQAPGIACLRHVNAALEIWPPHGHYGRLADELRWTRCRLPEALSLPPLSEGWRLPPPAVASAAVRQNVTYREHLGAARLVRSWHADAYAAAVAETERLADVWCSVARATEGPDWLGRRRGLARLREVLGDRDYLTGTLPPPVPLGWLAAAD